MGRHLSEGERIILNETNKSINTGTDNAVENEEKCGKQIDVPTFEQIKQERNRLKYKNRFKRTMMSTIGVLVVAAALAVLVATIWMPVLRIYGHSMSPALDDGQIVVCIKTGNIQTGDLAAFYHGNKLLVKRCIAGEADWVDMDIDGNIYVNGELLEEPYISEKALGDTNISLPYQVPDGRWFMVGDNRGVSVDSRNTAVGCIAEEQLVGKIVFCVWPLSEFGKIG